MSAAIIQFCRRSDIHLDLCNITRYIFYNMTREIFFYFSPKCLHGTRTWLEGRGKGEGRSPLNFSLKLYLYD